jgi:hypothetical protein
MMRVGYIYTITCAKFQKKCTANCTVRLESIHKPEVVTVLGFWLIVLLILLFSGPQYALGQAPVLGPTSLSDIGFREAQASATLSGTEVFLRGYVLMPGTEGTPVAGQPGVVTYAESPWSNTFTKLSNPNTLPTGTGMSTSWSPDGQYLSVAHNNSPFITIYKRNGDTFTKLPDPITLPPSTANGTSWSPDGQYLGWGSRDTGRPG